MPVYRLFLIVFVHSQKKKLNLAMNTMILVKEKKSIAFLKPLNYNKKWSNEQEQTINNQK